MQVSNTNPSAIGHRMTTTTNTTASLVTGPALFVQNLVHMLCDDIDADRFADRVGTTINHPAFVLGHTAYYAGVCVQILGGTCTFDEGEAELYQHGAECLDDASKYPGKDACIARFESRCQEATEFIVRSDVSLLEQSAKDTPFAERFGTLGEVASFMLVGHPCFHLGQLSAWRRVAGMSSAS